MSKASEIAVNSLQSQLETSVKVAELAKLVSTMTGVVTEASKASSQLEHILNYIHESKDAQSSVQDIATNVDLLAVKAQGVYPHAKTTKADVCPEQLKKLRVSWTGYLPQTFISNITMSLRRGYQTQDSGYWTAMFLELGENLKNLRYVVWEILESANPF